MDNDKDLKPVRIESSSKQTETLKTILIRRNNKNHFFSHFKLNDMDLMDVKLETVFAGISVIFAAYAIYTAKIAEKKAELSETIKNFLGEKEAVAHAAMQYLREKELPQEPHKRKVVIEALMTVCLFEKSDRARALCFMVIEKNKAKYKAEFESAYAALDETRKNLESYGFEKEELDFTSTHAKLRAIETLLNGKKK